MPLTAPTARPFQAEPELAAPNWLEDGRAWCDVAVVMQRVATQGTAARWQPWRWQLAEVLPDVVGAPDGPHLLHQNESTQRWLHAHLRVELFKDDAEGLVLNLTSGAPSWFVLWRMEEQARLAPPDPIAVPTIVTLSYYDAGRWLDAQETVEQVPAQPVAVRWLSAFCDAHYQPEPRQRRRPQSFRPLTDRFGQPASVSGLKTFGGGGGHG